MTAGLSLRDQVQQWANETNGVYVLEDYDPRNPPEPDWEMHATEVFKGDMQHALGWLEAGFWGDPRPFFDLSYNNHIIIRTLGSRE